MTTVPLDESGKVLRDKIQRILGDLSSAHMSPRPPSATADGKENRIIANSHPDRPMSVVKHAKSSSTLKIADNVSARASTGVSTAAASPREVESAASKRLESIMASLDAGSIRPVRTPLSVHQTAESYQHASTIANVQLKARNETLQLEVDELNQAMGKLRDELAASEAGAKQEKTRAEQRRLDDLAALEKKLTETIDRNFEMIEQLLSEKREAFEKINHLIYERKEMESRLAVKVERNDEAVRKELQREKEQWMVQEKQARARWEQKRIAEIKEQTVKGLEPEIERILASHKQERRVIELKHLEELEAVKTDNVLKANAMVREARGLVVDEVRVALERERERFRAKESEQFNKHMAELAVERERRALEVAEVRESYNAKLISEAARFEKESTKLAEAARANAQVEAELRARDEKKLNARVEEIVKEREAVLRRTFQGQLDAQTAELRAEMEAEKVQQVEGMIEKVSAENLAIVDEARAEERNKAAAELTQLQRELRQVRNSLADIARARDDSEKRIAEKDTAITTIEGRAVKAESVSLELRQELDKRKSELDDVKFEKLNLIHKLKISENQIELFKESELAQVEQRIAALVTDNERERARLVENVAYLEAKNKGLNELLLKQRHSHSSN